jgi:hypothetical protein
VLAALHAAREVAAPDWLASAGAVRDAVWDTLHGRAPTAMPRDVDLAFFDPIHLSPARDAAVEAALRRHAPELPWEATNRAAVHTWYPTRFGVAVLPFASCAEAIATYPEVASCVGVRLLDDDDLLVVAPYGLDDLLDGVCRHNPTRVSARFYTERQAAKQWPTRWPCVRYLEPVNARRSAAGSRTRNGRSWFWRFVTCARQRMPPRWVRWSSAQVALADDRSAKVDNAEPGRQHSHISDN